MRNYKSISVKEVFGNNTGGNIEKRLRIFNTLGTKFSGTGLIPILGGFSSTEHYASGERTLDNQAVYVAMTSRDIHGYHDYIGCDGFLKEVNKYCNSSSMLLSSSYSSESEIPSTAEKGPDGILRFFDGEMPTEPYFH